MATKEKYDSFEVYGAEDATDAGIFVEVYDGKMNICYYILDYNGTPYGNQDLELSIHIDKENIKKIANKFRVQTDGQLAERFGEIFVRHNAKVFEVM